MSTDASSDDDDFNYEANSGSRRYPVHDCCEFEDAESLRNLIVVRLEESDAEDGASNSASDDDGSTSSTDDNDSREAAHLAAVGHSPQATSENTVRAASAIAVATRHVNDNTSKGDPPNESLSLAHGAEEKIEDAGSQPQAEGVPRDENGDQPKGATAGKADAVVTPISDNEREEHPGERASHAVLQERTIQQATSSEVIPSETKTTEDNVASKATAGAEVTVDLKSLQKDDSVGDEKNDNVSASIDVACETQEISKPEGYASKKRKKPHKKPSYYSPYDLDERDDDENTPLHVAIHARKIEHVKILLDAGASVHKRCDGSGALHTAISIGAIPEFSEFAYECIAALRAHGADMSMKDDSFHTPLYLACMVNLPQVVSLLLSDPEGVSALNMKADRVGGRPLHAAAKYDTICKGRIRNGTRTALASDHHPFRADHHPDGTVAHKGQHHKIPGSFYFQMNSSETHRSPENQGTPSILQQQGVALVTQMLLAAPGIEIDATDSNGRTPLHIACARGNWPVARLLLNAGASPQVQDRRGLYPGQLGDKRGMAIPNDLLNILGQHQASTEGMPVRDLIVDPDSTTMLLCHELCSRHRSCPPIMRGGMDVPPENVRRLHVLINEEDGILRSREFGVCAWETSARRAAMSDILKVHEYAYVEKINEICASLPDHPSVVQQIDPDTAVSRWSFEAALRAAGSVCEAVDKVVSGEHRNAFCAVRPPGHHAGPRGIVKCANDPEGSHGFCLLNNVAIGAAYARTMYRNDGIRKVAIIDFDVHHGNGTEEIIRQLVPHVQSSTIRTPFAVGSLQTSSYRPWLDETDVDEVFFASAHGYGPRVLELGDTPAQGGWFYPASGKSVVTDSLSNPSRVETPGLADFLMSQTWARMGDESRMNCCKIINCGLPLPGPDEVPGMQRLEVRDSYRKIILPRLREFDPDMIFISAGFDAHKKDTMNFGYVGMIEDDYEWVTEQLVKVANTCCNGRIVSVLEGGYKIHGGIVSPFARSVASHVRALADGGRSRALYDARDADWESQFELHMVEEREKKRQQKIDRLRRQAEFARRQLMGAPLHRNINDRKEGTNGDEATLKDLADLGKTEEPSRKRQRNHVDYRELYEKMKREEGLKG